MPNNFVHYQISTLILTILICCFSNVFCIFFACIISSNVIYNYFSLFIFNCCYYYLTIILYLLISNIVILDEFSQLIYIFFAVLESFPRSFSLYFLYKSTSILHNNTSVGYIKLQALLFYAKLLFSIGQAINILVESI